MSDALERSGYWYEAVFGEEGDSGVVDAEWGLSAFTPEWLRARLLPTGASSSTPQAATRATRTSTCSSGRKQRRSADEAAPCTSGANSGAAMTIPYPPIGAREPGRIVGGAGGPYAFYDLVGRESKNAIVALLPDDWSWEGIHVLDFGAGAGRTCATSSTRRERARSGPANRSRERRVAREEPLSSDSRVREQ